MKSCIEYQEMISQYIDGELSPEDERELSEHISHCDGCRALLEIYSACHAAYSGEDTTPPAELLEGVMSGIAAPQPQASSPRRAAGRSRSEKSAIITLAALAACAAIVVFSFPGIFRPEKKSDFTANDTASPPSTTESAESAEIDDADLDFSDGTDADVETSPGDTFTAAPPTDDSTGTAAEDPEYFAVVTIEGELPDILNGDDFQDQKDGTYSLTTHADTVTALEELGFSVVYSENNSENALIIWIP